MCLEVRCRKGIRRARSTWLLLTTRALVVLLLILGGLGLEKLSFQVEMVLEDLLVLLHLKELLLGDLR